MKCNSVRVQACKSASVERKGHLHAHTHTRLHTYTLTRLHAFTLTELLVAIAILSIMFTLLFIPMTQAFDNARRGRIMANLQNAADFALEWMVRELTQAVDIMPQERVDANGQPLNLLDDDDNPGDDDTLSRLDFVARFPDEGKVTVPPAPTAWSYQVITYYLRRSDPSRPYQYMDAVEPANRRQIFRAQWIPDLASADPEPTQQDPQGRWIVRGAWLLADLSQLPPNRLVSHNALTPADMDVADLRFTVERRQTQDPRLRKPVAVVIELTIRQPTPGARIKDGNPNETDVPSLFVRRRVKVVLQNVR
ncbi:MAG: type II secretion system protein [Candidatus Fervidibacter sacchari]